MNRSLISSLVVITAILAGPQLLQAQGQGFGLEVNAGYDMMTGDDFDAFDNDIGYEVIGSYAWISGWELGIGAGFSDHEFNGGPSVDQMNVFGEGRYRFGAPASLTPHVHPFVQGRIGYTRLDLENDASQSGLLVGAGAGVEYWISNEVAVLGDGVIHFLSYGDSDDIPVKRDGTEFSLRGGLKVRFPTSR